MVYVVFHFIIPAIETTRIRNDGKVKLKDVRIIIFKGVDMDNYKSRQITKVYIVPFQCFKYSYFFITSI